MQTQALPLRGGGVKPYSVITYFETDDSIPDLQRQPSTPGIGMSVGIADAFARDLQQLKGLIRSERVLGRSINIQRECKPICSSGLDGPFDLGAQIERGRQLLPALDEGTQILNDQIKAR